MKKIKEAALAYAGQPPPGEGPMARLLDKGASALSVSEILSLVLGCSTIEAQHIMDTFRDIHTLGRATAYELQRLHGVGPALAARVMAAFELGRRNMTYTKHKPQVRSPADVYNVVAPEMIGLGQEHLKVVVLDTKNYVICMPTVYIGSANTSLLRVSEIFSFAIRHGGVAIIIVHNHPSGDPTPSPEDVAVTQKIVDASKLLEIDVLDHLIIGQGRFVSLKERGLGGFQ